MKISVEVKPDFLQRLIGVKNPVINLSELIWNGFDADASEVKASLDLSELGAIDEIRVSDNGHGMPHAEALIAFKDLGGSLKQSKIKSSSGRMLHGKAGKGRFRALGLGQKVEWITHYKKDGDVYEYRIIGTAADPGTFEIEDEKPSTRRSTGTEVRITGVRDFRKLTLEGGGLYEIATNFALYLRQYPKVSLYYEGQKVNPSNVQEHEEDYQITGVQLPGGRQVNATLTVIEWTPAVERALYLCDQSGFSLEKTALGIHASGFNYTGYLKSDLIRELDNDGTLQLDELNDKLVPLLDATKTKLKEHFRKRSALKASDVVNTWKNKNIYPFKDAPQNQVEVVERQVFDVVAINLHHYLPDFDKSSDKNKRIQLELLRQTLETSPEIVQKIMRDVLELPKEKQQEFAELLEKTTLSAVINASKVVANRLNFIKGLEAVVYEHDISKKVKEREHLHQILTRETWLFGEKFNLSVSDGALTTVLRKHYLLAGRTTDDIDPIYREDGTAGRVDLMFSKRIPHHDNRLEHLVVELKRPGTVLDSSMANQIESYALKVSTDERFQSVGAKWTFWLISNDMTPELRAKIRQANREEGILLQTDGIVVWVKTWAQIIEECSGRLRFFQEKLEFGADQSSGIEYLKKMHAKYLPKDLQKEPQSQNGTVVVAKSANLSSR